MYYRKAAFCCAFFWGGGQHNSMQGIFMKKCFLFTVGGVCCVKQFTTGPRNVADLSLMTKRLKWRCGSGRDSRPLCCGFRRTGKAMGQAYQCWWRICQEINVFPQVRVSYLLRFMAICDLFTDSPSYYTEGQLKTKYLL
jgi:hypothetical protein